MKPLAKMTARELLDARSDADFYFSRASGQRKIDAAFKHLRAVKAEILKRLEAFDAAQRGGKR